MVTYVHRGKIEDEVRAFLKNGGTGAIVGLHAPGGLGKTELAKKVAEEFKNQFEGVLWVEVSEKTPQQVVADMLLKCNIQIQPGAAYAAQKNELHAYLKDHRLLVVLDDVREKAKEGLADYLPPKPCSTLITSRIQQFSGVKDFPLDHMTPEQARELLEAVLGEDVVRAEADAADKLAERCAWNPLALEISARRIRQMQGDKKPISKYLDKVKARFGELYMAGDERWDMAHVFDVSYDDLSPEDQGRFRKLAAFHPTGFAPEAAAYIWECDDETAGRTLVRFRNLSLVKPAELQTQNSERLRLHDLLDEYAEGKLKKAEKEEKEAKIKLAEWIIELFGEHYTDDPSNAPEVELEFENLKKSAEWAGAQKDGRTLALLATKPRNWLYNVFRSLDLWRSWLGDSLRYGIDDRENDGKQLIANVLQAIGDVQQFRAERDAALVSYNEALKLFKEIGAKLGEANVLMSLGDYNLAQQKWNEAIKYYEQTLPIYQVIQAQLGQANTLIDLGKAYFEVGEHEKGMGYVKESGDIFARIGSGYWAVKAYRRLAGMLKQCDRIDEAKQIEDQLDEMEKRG